MFRCGFDPLNPEHLHLLPCSAPQLPTTIGVAYKSFAQALKSAFEEGTFFENVHRHLRFKGAFTLKANFNFK